MKTCAYAGEPFSALRSHPWLDSASDPNARYHDFRASPQLIQSALEDFVPWARFSAVQAFYTLLRRLNHERSTLETNDCEFTGPHANETPSIAKALSCSGRLMLLFRALRQNTEASLLESLEHGLHVQLNELDEAFAWGLVGTTIVPTRFLALPAANDQQLGNQLMISFWAWGDTEADTMQNLGRLFTNLTRALRSVVDSPR